MMNAGGDDFYGHGSRKGKWHMLDKHKFSIISWIGVCILVLFVWHFISDKDFSFLMTLGSVLRMFSFMLLLTHVWTTRSNAGLSLKTLQAYACVFTFRLCSILFYEGYLPYDRSGDWFYQAVEIMALAVVCVLIFVVTTKFPGSYNEAVDCFGKMPPNVPNKLGVVWLLVPAFLLALVLHPSLNGNFITDTAWAFALYVEAVAVLPQLYLFHRRRGLIDGMLSNYVFALGVSRLLQLIFWVSSFQELNDARASSITAQYPGYLVVFSQVVHILLMGNFFWLYLDSARQGKPMYLPVSV